ncbi:HEAT repeat domain-containing protein [Streptomyces sp. NPDC091272]|uniref:HEAT repeat domain-containing protein n=1 Tax=Streptomyces sp. NPDC091272 TaxID=3365981 RepID=UPI003814EB57
MLIGELARRSGVSARMLRHYETLGLVRPTARTGAGYREYSAEDIRRVFHIESLRSLGLSLREVGRALDDPGFTPAELVDDLARRTRARIAAERELLARLDRIGAAEPAGWQDVLRGVELLQALGSPSAGRRQSAALSAVDGAPVPVEALAEAVLGERDPHVAGALRWALAQSGDGGRERLAEGLGSPDAAVRERAVRALAEITDEAATALLREALAHPDPVVRRHAAPALAARHVADAVPTLVEMVAADTNDVVAADALGELAARPAVAERVTGALVARMARDDAGSPARRRLTQALAEIPGDAAARALTELSHDEDRTVALTAAYILGLREAAPAGDREAGPAGDREAGPTGSCEAGSAGDREAGPTGDQETGPTGEQEVTGT